MYKVIFGLFLCCCVLVDTCWANPNVFNPYMQQKLPPVRLDQESKDILASIGGRAMNIQDEAQHRPQWRAEVYPIVFGSRTGANEILVFLDYANPQSQRVWDNVVKSIRKLDPYTSKIVVFAKNSEKYGTELTGGGIWLSYTRPERAMEYFSYTLAQWNNVKAALAAQGRSRPFEYEFDATAKSEDFPILYSYLMTLQPPVSESQEQQLLKYCYDAGNVNMFQAVSISRYYSVKNFPAVVVNGRPLAQVTPEAIIQATQSR